MSSVTDKKLIEIKNGGLGEKPTVIVIGCERNGILHACLFAEAGFKVICADNDRAVVDRVSKAKVPFLKNEVEPILRRNLTNGRLKVVSDVENASTQSDIVIVTTTATMNEKGKIDYSNMERMLRRLGSNLHKNALIIIASVVGIGVTENTIKEILESVSGLKVSADFYLAYSPIPFPEEQTLNNLANCKRIVAASDKASLERVSNVIGAITRLPLIKSSDIKAAEAAVLFEIARRNANLALTNEFAFFCEKTGIDYLAVQNLMATDIGMFAQPALESENEHEALQMLLEEAETQNVKLRVSAVALESNKETLRHGVNLIREALKSCGKALRRAKIALLGASQTPNMAGTPKNSVKAFVKMLETKGARPVLYDPYLTRRTVTDLEQTAFKKSLTEAVEGADCIVIFTGHDQFKRLNLRKLKLLAKTPAAVVDFEGILDPKKVEEEGFVYRGFGRGVWKK
ncbi:MAG: nucleotide sugar dehydrogenase [Candidatus Bathyarchaeota archaeon]|nr:nucleotide sugar dehydrogenase [Candidatus Bathyarchaeota archaeon A05DMB-3]MDH7607330.1 nucleotide sugar dehydrogenase [Candidatus Bathyarchaeota archaeon]